MSVRRLVIAAAVNGTVLTFGVMVLPFVRFVYRNPSWHVAIETAAVLIGFLGALLLYGRFRRTNDLRDLAMVYVLGVLCFTNLFFAMLPSLLNVARGETFVVWTQATARSLAVAVLALAAFSSRPWSHRHALGGLSVVAASVMTLVLVAVVAALARPALPDPIGSIALTATASRPRIEGHPIFLGLQLAQTLLFIVAAVGFTKRAGRDGERAIVTWLAPACVLGAFSRFNYFLFPSLYTDYVHVGDVFRLGFYGCLLIGGVGELSWYWRNFARSQVMEARQAIARDLHDGVAQELVFITAQTRRLRDRPIERHDLDRLISAADRAVAEARRAIRALSFQREQSLAEALADLGEEIGQRTDVKVELDLEEVETTPLLREAVVRVVREALMNVVRHSSARVVKIELRDDDGPWVCVRDDGTGFDVEAARQRKRGFGLASMEERARAFGGTTRVSSARGVGTEVVIDLPRQAPSDGDW